MQHKRRLISLFVLVALLLSACQTLPPPPVAGTQAASDEDVTAAVNAIWDEYEASLLAGDADRWIAQWAENGVQMPPDMPPRVGKETIYKAVSGFLDNFEYTEFVINNEDVEVNGDLAFARGNYTGSFVAKSGGDPVNIEGKYMTILRQQPDGSWKLYRDIFNSNVPPVPVAAPVVDVDAVTEAVNAIWREYEASIEAGDAGRWGALWVDDGVKYPPDGPMLEGKEAIVDNMREWMAIATADDVAITNHTVEVAGDFAFAKGLFRVDAQLKANGMPVVMDGKYMSIFQRQPDGSWKLYRDIFNSNVPPAAPPVAEETDVEAVTAEILTIWDEYVTSTLTNDTERRLALWADDGVILRTGRPPVVGKEAIRERVAGNFAKTTYDEMTIDNMEIEVSGDMAFARGKYMVKAVDNATGEPIFDDGTYMSIFRLQPDGSWKLYRDMAHSNIPPTPPTDVNVVTEAVNGIWREYEASLLAGDADRWIAQWAENGVQMPPDMPPRVGKETIYKAVSGFLDNFEYTEFVINNEDVEVNGDLAFARGNYTGSFVAKSGGDPVNIEGKYMTILRQQPDGGWKIYRDIFNSNVP